MNTTQKNAIFFIFITLVIDVIGFGIIIPVMPKLIKELINRDLSSASKIGGWLLFAYAFTQFVFAPIVGNLSDQFGRRPILLLSLFGFAIDYLFLAFAPTIAWLFLGRIIAGITGASMTTASAYIADISTAENRTKNFGMIGAAFGIGFIVGPAIGGFLGTYGARVPFYAAAILCFVNFLYGYYILPESLQPENRRQFSWKRANPIGAFKSLKKYPNLYGLLFALFLVNIGSHAVHSNWSYFTMYQFKWSEALVGASLGFVGLLVGVVQGGLIRWINPKLGNQKSIIYGLFLYALGMLLFAFATETWMMFVFLIPYCLGGICGPAIQALISENIPANEQGEIQGTLTSLVSLTSIVGPPLMTGIFAFYTKKEAPLQFAGAPFVLGAILMAISVLVVYFSFKSINKKEVQ
jgi:MFS transporter, DHA1 family, tetracycline resistance protein